MSTRLSVEVSTIPIAEDATLIVQVASGDRSALAALYDRHASALLGLGIRVLRSHRDAEDVLHDVFIEVWRRAHSYEPARASVRGWLMLMMRCRALDRRKSAAFARSTSLDLVRAELLGQADAPPSLDHARAVSALAVLPEGQREVLVLGYFHGLSSSEISSELDIPIGTVKSRVAAGLRALRDAMGIEPAVRSAEEGSPS